ncbi:MAG: hypothetical protein MH825_09140 [Cyanobacteria bacterium]|nr:hypothetical protein [Cyanobacteriota bacterium]
MKRFSAIAGMVSGLVGGAIGMWAIAAPPALAQFEGFQTYCWGTLSAEEDDVQIHLNAGPGENFQTLSYHPVGETVWLLRSSLDDGLRQVETMTDQAGLTWYRVAFSESGEEGWIRSDLLIPECAETLDRVPLLPPKTP